MTATNDGDQTPRVKPDERAWLEAQRTVAERNEQVRKAGMAARNAREQREKAALLRSERDGIYR